MEVTPLYHGTNARFGQFEQSKARIQNDFYGGGVAYFTDNLNIAKTYAKSAAKKGGDPIIYQVSLKVNKLFDVEAKFTGKDLTQFYNKREAEQFARGAGLLSLGRDRYTVLDELEEGTAVLTGDQVFRGLSQGMVKTAAAREKLKSLGYDGLKHIGGVNMNQPTKHNVYLAYMAFNIKITQRMLCASDQTIKEGHLGQESYVLI